MNVVIRVTDGVASLLVDEIGEVVEVDAAQLEPAPLTVTDRIRDVIGGAGERPGVGDRVEERLPLRRDAPDDGDDRSEMPQIVKAIDAGASEYVMKPFTHDATKEKLRMIGLGPEHA